MEPAVATISGKENRGFIVHCQLVALGVVYVHVVAILSWRVCMNRILLYFLVAMLFSRCIKQNTLVFAAKLSPKRFC